MPLEPVYEMDGELKMQREWKFLPPAYKCPICGCEIANNHPDIEYIKTKRGEHLFVHTRCVRRK